MRSAIIIIGVVGLLLFLVGHITGKSSDSDEAFSAIIPLALGAVLVAFDIVLVILYALYRLFSAT